MIDYIVIGIIVIVVIAAIASGSKHFKGQGGCCGGGNTYIEKKKLSKVIAKKNVTIEGMTCENCAARVTRAINQIEGASCKVDMKKKKAVVSMENEIENEVIQAAIEKAGYTVISIQ